MTTSTITLSKAMHGDFEQVGRMVSALLLELYPAQQETFNESSLAAVAVKLLGSESGVWAFIARTEEKIVGFITLNECASIYAEGVFGEISELYVLPEFRSLNIGASLLEAADEFAEQKQWPFLEVGAPALPAWQRSLDFYIRNGFSTIGPRLERNVKLST